MNLRRGEWVDRPSHHFKLSQFGYRRGLECEVPAAGLGAGLGALLRARVRFIGRLKVGSSLLDVRLRRVQAGARRLLVVGGIGFVRLEGMVGFGRIEHVGLDVIRFNLICSGIPLRIRRRPIWAAESGETDDQSGRITQIDHRGIELAQRLIDSHATQPDAPFGVEQRCRIRGQQQRPAVAGIGASGKLQVDRI